MAYIHKVIQVDKISSKTSLPLKKPLAFLLFEMTAHRAGLAGTFKLMVNVASSTNLVTE